MRILVWQKEHTLYVWVSGMRKGGRVVSIAGNVCVNTAFSKLLLLNFSNLKKINKGNTSFTLYVYGTS